MMSKTILCEIIWEKIYLVLKKGSLLPASWVPGSCLMKIFMEVTDVASGQEQILRDRMLLPALKEAVLPLQEVIA